MLMPPKLRIIIGIRCIPGCNPILSVHRILVFYNQYGYIGYRILVFYNQYSYIGYRILVFYNQYSYIGYHILIFYN